MGKYASYGVFADELEVRNPRAGVASHQKIMFLNDVRRESVDMEGLCRDPVGERDRSGLVKIKGFPVDTESSVGFLCLECGKKVGSIRFVCYVTRKMC